MGEHQNSRRIKLDRGAEKKGTADERRGEGRGEITWKWKRWEVGGGPFKWGQEPGGGEELGGGA